MLSVCVDASFRSHFAPTRRMRVAEEVVRYLAGQRDPHEAIMRRALERFFFVVT